MSEDLDRLRAYARRTAAELVAAGVQPERITSGGHSIETSRTVGWLFKRTVVERREVPLTVLLEGWPLWRQTMNIVEYRRPRAPVAGGWREEESIWLNQAGELLMVAMQTDRWPGGESGPVLKSTSAASDSDLTSPDRHWLSHVRSPRVPRSARDGRWESEAQIGKGERLPPGKRISRSLTALRKSSGTYVERPRRSR